MKYRTLLISSLLILPLMLSLIGCRKDQPTPDKAVVGASHASNEGVIIGQMHAVHRAEEMYKNTAGNYGSIDQLVEKGMLNRDPSGHLSYQFNVMSSNDHYQCTAVPQTYGTTGTISYYIDDSGILHGADHHGGAANASDARIGQ